MQRKLIPIIPVLALAACHGGVSGPDLDLDFGSNTSGNGRSVRGSGNVVTEARDVTRFDRVRLDGIGNLTLHRAATESLELTADDNVLPLLRSDVRGGELQLGIDDDINLRQANELRYDIGFRGLTRLELAGAIEADGAGVDGDTLDVALAGAIDLRLGGRVDRHDVDLRGAGSYQAGALRTRVASVSIAGAGHVVVRVSERLDVQFAGAGVVEYFGDPVISVSGLGTVRKLD